MAGLPPLSPRPSPYARKSLQAQQPPSAELLLESSIYDLNKALNHFRKRAVLEEDVRQIFERQDANDNMGGTASFESTNGPRQRMPRKIPRSASVSSLSSTVSSSKSATNKQVQFLDHPEVFIIPMDRDWISSRRSPISLL